MNDVLKDHPTPWRVVQAGERVIRCGYTGHAEDTCIADANNVEVIGCSEWIRGEESFQFIVDLVNRSAS